MTPAEWIVLGGTVAGALSAMGGVAAWVARIVRQPLETGLASACANIATETKDRTDALAALEARIAATTGHKTNNNAARIDALERARVQDVERIVKIETNQAAIKEGQMRIEHSLEVMKSEQAAARAEIIDTIREMSKRELR